MSSLPPGIDHLIFTAPTLEEGMDEIEKRLGIRPVRGGRHPGFGTHNALLSFGQSTYLEVIAPDPDLPVPEKGLFLEEFYHRPPQLATWVYRMNNLHEMVETATNNGQEIGSVEAGSRQKPDGTTLAWQLTDPYVLPMEGAVPFLIDWGKSVHPSTTAPFAGEILDFRIEHSQPEKLNKSLRILGASIRVLEADRFRIITTIKTPVGRVALF